MKSHPREADFSVVKRMMELTLPMEQTTITWPEAVQRRFLCKGNANLSKPSRVSGAQMVILGAGWFGTQFFWGFHTGSMPLFLENFTDLKFMISLVLSIAGITGCIVPPVVGYLSDRSKTRFGRRRPYIMGGMLGVFLCALLLPHAGTFAVVAIISGLMYFFIGFAQAPYLSLLPDVTPVHQRSTASGVMYLMGGIGLASYFIVGSAIWEEHTVAVFHMVAAVSFGSVLVTVAFVKEPGRTDCESPKGTGPLEYLGSVARETNVLRYFLAQLFWWMGIWMVSAFLTLFMVEELNLAEGKSLLIMMAFSLTATASMLPLGMLGDRLGRKGILSCMLGFWVVGLIFVCFSNSQAAVLVTVVLTGIPFAAVMGIGYAYTLDIIPQERIAEYLGLSSISICIPQIFGPMIGGKLIDTVGYRSIFIFAALFMVGGFIILQFTKPRQRAANLANGKG